jgi:drug/metabolite transporter (DMT)-like permease
MVSVKKIERQIKEIKKEFAAIKSIPDEIFHSQKENESSLIFWAAWGALIGLMGGVISGAFYYGLQISDSSLATNAEIAIIVVALLLSALMIYYKPDY